MVAVVPSAKILCCCMIGQLQQFAGETKVGGELAKIQVDLFAYIVAFVVGIGWEENFAVMEDMLFLVKHAPGNVEYNYHILSVNPSVL